MELKNCLTCEKEIKTYPSTSDSRRFCSRFCYTISPRFQEVIHKWREKCPNKYNRVEKHCLTCNNKFFVSPSRLRIEFCSRNCLHKSLKIKETALNNLIKSGQLRSKFGEANPNWRGGKSSEAKRIRDSKEYQLWRKAVFERDVFTCVFCKKIGGRLNADHIKPFSEYPKLRLSIENGRTLCEPCHKNLSTWLNNSRKYGFLKGGKHYVPASWS